jgi:hypothetical protein
MPLQETRKAQTTRGQRVKHPEKNTLSALDIVLPLIVYKAFVYALIFLTLELFPQFFDLNAYYANFHWPPDAKPDTSTMFATWDAQMHLQLSYEGYKKGMLSVNHQPLWPALIKLFSYLTFGNHLVASLILANILSVAGFWLLFVLVRNDYGERVATTTSLLMLAFPGALFYSFPYTESLFLFLCALFFLFLKKGDYLVAAGLGFFMPLARIVGVFCVLPFGWEIFSRERNQRKLLLYAVSPLLGLLTAFLIVYLYTGTPLAAFEVQSRYVSQGSITKIFQISGFLSDTFRSVSFYHGVLDSAFDRIWFAWFVVTLPFIYMKDKTYFIYALLMGLVPAMTQSFMSYTRYVAVVFPMFIVTAELFLKIQKQTWLWLTLAILFSIQILFLLRHINFLWVA